MGNEVGDRKYRHMDRSIASDKKARHWPQRQHDGQREQARHDSASDMQLLQDGQGWKTYTSVKVSRSKSSRWSLNHPHEQQKPQVLHIGQKSSACAG